MLWFSLLVSSCLFFQYAIDVCFTLSFAASCFVCSVSKFVFFTVQVEVRGLLL